MRYNIYLIKDGHRDDFIKENLVYSKDIVTLPSGVQGTSYFREKTKIPLSSLGLLARFHNLSSLTGTVGVDYDAISVFEMSGQVFVCSWGGGQSLLQPGSFVSDFGKVCSSKLVSVKQIKRLVRTELGRNPYTSTNSFAKPVDVMNIPPSGFLSILGEIGGRCSSQELLINISGKASCKVLSNVDFGQIDTLFEFLLIAYKSRKKSKFDELETMSKVTDPETKIELFIKLENLLSKRDTNHIQLMVDLLDESGHATSLEIHAGVKTVRLERPDIESYYESQPSNKVLKVSTLKKQKIVLRGSTDAGEIRVYDCLLCDIELNQQTYYFVSGQWLQYSSNLVSILKNLIRPYVMAASPLGQFNNTDSETAFNRKVAKKRNMVLTDSKMIFPNHSRGGFELGDFVSLDGTIYLIKKAGKAAGISHLGTQIKAAILPLISERDTEGTFRKLCPGVTRLCDVKLRIGIMTENEKDFLDQQTFLNLIALESAIRTVKPYVKSIQLFKIEPVRRLKPKKAA